MIDPFTVLVWLLCYLAVLLVVFSDPGESKDEECRCREAKEENSECSGFKEP